VENYKRSPFTAREREILLDEHVEAVLAELRASRATPYLMHKLNTALATAGMMDKAARERMIATLRRTKKWGF
jgi:hypothetical protein